MTRLHNRQPDQLRQISFDIDASIHAEGSVLVSFGNTMVLCTATIEQGVPIFLRGKGQGWVTAEYGMLPRSTGVRNRRESMQGKQNGRSQEIQRLIGRSLRSVVDLKLIKELTVTIDCDVIQADGGTRTAAISGGYICLYQALRSRNKQNSIRAAIAALSVGIVNDTPMLDLDYSEDANAQTDLNLVMTDSKEIVEIQGTAEQKPFDRNQLNDMLELGEEGITQLLQMQQKVLL